jgi:hypothetical protein
MILMFRVRFVLFFVVGLSMFAVFVSSASAKIAFQWKVGGKVLAAGEQRTFTASAGSTLDLKMTVSGMSVLLLATKLKVEPGARIIGGTPGANEATLVFEGVTSDRPGGCEVESLPNPVAGIVRTVPLKTEIVEGQTSHEPLELITPKTGANFAELRFLGASCTVKNVEANFTGDSLADPLPQLTESLTGLVDFDSSQGNNYLLSTGGALETAGLVFAGNPAMVGGDELMTSVSDEKLGAF